MSLQCPQGTKISITSADYGSRSSGENHCSQLTHGLNTCFVESFIHFVESKCQTKQNCTFGLTNEHIENAETCQPTDKLATISYKCKPTKFLTSLVCKDDPVPLSCSSSFHRLMIFSSHFSPAAQALIYCPLYPEEYQQDYHQDKEYVQDSSVIPDMKKCTDTPVTSYFINACHGQKQCNLTANPLALEVDQCSELYVYLKTVFACVDMRVIQNAFVDRVTQQNEFTLPTVKLNAKSKYGIEKEISIPSKLSTFDK